MVWVEEEAQREKAALLSLKLNTAVEIKWICSILWRRALGEGGSPAQIQNPWAWCIYGTQLGASLPPPPFPHCSSHSFQDVSSVLFLLACPLNQMAWSFWKNQSCFLCLPHLRHPGGCPLQLSGWEWIL